MSASVFMVILRAGIGSTERAGVTNGSARVLQAGAAPVAVGCKTPVIGGAGSVSARLPVLALQE